MSLTFDNVLRAIKRVRDRLHDGLFALACRILLPFSTPCRVCNMLRGMVIGIFLGGAIACQVIALLLHHWRGA